MDGTCDLITKAARTTVYRLVQKENSCNWVVTTIDHLMQEMSSGKIYSLLITGRKREDIRPKVIKYASKSPNLRLVTSVLNDIIFVSAKKGCGI